jgi:hypothetical protein
LSNIDKAREKYESKYRSKPFEILKVKYESRTKKLITLTGKRQLLNSCFLMIDRDKIVIFTYGLVKSDIREEFLLKEIEKIEIKRILGAYVFQFETEHRKCKVQSIKSGDLLSFLNLIQNTTGLNIIGLDKLKEKPTSSKDLLLKSESIDENSIVDSIEANGAFILLTDSYLFVSRVGITSGSFGGRKIKKISLNTINGVDVRQALLTTELEIITSGSLEITNSHATLSSRANNENILFFPKDSYPKVYAFGSKIMDTRDKKPASNSLRNEVSLTDQLKKLSELRDLGILTDKEFDIKKAEILSRI